MHSRLKTTGRSRRAATLNSIPGLPDTRLPRTVKWGAMTYSAWQCLALTDPTVHLGLLEVTEKMCGAGGGTCLCAFHINVSGCVHSAGPSRGCGSALCRLIASCHQQTHGYCTQIWSWWEAENRGCSASTRERKQIPTSLMKSGRLRLELAQY